MGQDAVRECHVLAAAKSTMDCPHRAHCGVGRRVRTARTIADVNASGLWPGKVVTEVAPVGPFWEAEPEHQDYLERYPNGYTCHFIRPDWKLPARNKTQAAQ